jgi:cobalt/nickel transport system ATP-binding protein
MTEAPILAITDLVFSYPDGTRALAGVSVSVLRGERVAVVGANGAGKSTFLLHLNGLLRGQGRIAVDGVVLDKHSLSAIRRRVGFVFQDPDDQLFCPTVADDVAFGPRQQRLPPDTVACRVTTALAAMDIRDLAQRHPHHLSLGQKKRAAIATALASEPDILVLDEPTSSLDPRSRRELIALLEGLDRTLVIATHDLPLVHHLCQRVLVLHAGRILADGPPSVILHDQHLIDTAHLA